MKCVGLSFLAVAFAEEACSSDHAAMIQSQMGSGSLKAKLESANLESVLSDVAESEDMSAIDVVSKAAMLLRATQSISVGFDTLPEATQQKLIVAAQKLQTSIQAAPELVEIFSGREQELLHSVIEVERSVSESPVFADSVSKIKSSVLLQEGSMDHSLAKKGGTSTGAVDATMSRKNCGDKCTCVNPQGEAMEGPGAVPFNITEYIKQSWYIQRQQVNGFQKAEDLFCVTATYNETFRGELLNIGGGGKQPEAYYTAFNNCNKGSKNSGTNCARHSDPDFTPSFGTPLCARSYDLTTPSQLKVAPCPLPKAFTGDYWVVAAGPSQDNYEWAVVTAGQPSVVESDGCTTPDSCSGPAQANCGLWLFSREPVPSQAVTDAMNAAATDAGISLNRVIDIDHTDCTYEGYFLKN